MKKVLNSAALGGAPVYKSDLRDIFQDELWDCIESIFSPFNSDTEGVIVTGCVVSGSGPYDISAGIVYLSGEFRRFAAVTGITLPKYIVVSTSFYDNRVYANGVSNDFAVTSNCELAASGTGQYIAITTPTDPDDRRWKTPLDQVRRFDLTVNTNSGGTAETIITIPRLTNKTMRIDARMVSSHVSGSDAAGSGSSAYKAAKYKDVAGTGTIIGSINDIDSDETGANAPVMTFTVSGTNLLVTAQAGSGEVYKVRIIADVIEI